MRRIINTNVIYAKELLCGLFAVSLITLAPCEVNAKSRVAGDQSRMKINLSGTVVVNGACNFTAGSASSVEYGNVRFHTDGGAIDGTYRKPLSSITCSGDVAGNPQLTLASSGGISVIYSGAKLLPVKIGSSSTNSTALAIRFLVNGTIQDVNTWFSLNTATIPTLEAELVQIGSGASFISGENINSVATLTMAFN